MNRFMRAAAIVLSALWVGMVFTVGFVVAPYLFTLAAQGTTAVPNTSVAGELIGPLLHAADVVSLGAGALLLFLTAYLRKARQQPAGSGLFLPELALASAITTAAANYWVIYPKVHAVRADLVERFGGYHLADKSDPAYLQFASLHQISTALYLAGFIGGLVFLACLAATREQGPVARPAS